MVTIYIVSKQTKENETATGIIIKHAEETLRYSIYHANATLNQAYLKALTLALKSIVADQSQIELEIISNRPSSITAALKMKQELADTVNYYLKLFRSYKISNQKCEELDICQKFSDDAFINKRTIFLS